MKQLERLSHLILFIAFAIGAIVFLKLRYNAQQQFMVLVALVFFYLIWGVIHHYIKRDLTKKLYSEYLIIASIASIVSFLVFAS